MSDRYIDYLKRERARLENELGRASRQMAPNQFTIARLKKLKLAMRDQIAWYERLMSAGRAA
jgi:hypothetical protein